MQNRYANNYAIPDQSSALFEKVWNIKVYNKFPNKIKEIYQFLYLNHVLRTYIHILWILSVEINIIIIIMNISNRKIKFPYYEQNVMSGYDILKVVFISN